MIEKMVKKRYYGNECFGLAWDRIEVRQMNLFITIQVNVFKAKSRRFRRFRILTNCEGYSQKL